MAVISGAQIGAGRFIGETPVQGIVAAEKTDGTVTNLLAADEATGNTVHSAFGPGGRHVFTDEQGNEVAGIDGQGLSVSGEVLAQGGLNVREWGNLLNAPSSFTPSAHTHPFPEITSRPTTLAGYGITDAAAAAHTHSAADVTAGILPVTRGGTGLFTAGTNGQVLTTVNGAPAWADPIGSAAGALTSAFTRVRNGAGVEQFTASGADALGLAAGTGLSVAFDPTNKRVTYTLGAHTHPFSDVTGRPTTLAGYGITDAATATHTHSAGDITSGTLADARLSANVALRSQPIDWTSTGTHSFAGAVTVAAQLGIGTTSPTESLHVVGNVRVSGTVGAVATPTYISMGSSFGTAPTAAPKLRLYDDATAVYGLGISNQQLNYLITDGAASHVWYVGGSERARLNSNGLGIGGNPGTNRLYVAGGVSSFQDTIQIGSAGNAYASISIYGNAAANGNFSGIRTFNGNALQLQTFNTAANVYNVGLSIDTAGRVGIGTTSPAETLHVAGGIRASGDVVLDNTRAVRAFNATGTNTWSLLRGLSNGTTHLLGEGGGSLSVNRTPIMASGTNLDLAGYIGGTTICLLFVSCTDGRNAVFALSGGNNGVSLVAQTGGGWSSTSGNVGTANVAWNPSAGAGAYQIQNNLGYNAGFSVTAIGL